MITGDLAVRTSGYDISHCMLRTSRASLTARAAASCISWQVDGGINTPLKFAQTFVLLPSGTSWVVGNDVFRLNYG